MRHEPSGGPLYLFFVEGGRSWEIKVFEQEFFKSCARILYDIKLTIRIVERLARFLSFVCLFVCLFFLS